MFVLNTWISKSNKRTKKEENRKNPLSHTWAPTTLGPSLTLIKMDSLFFTLVDSPKRKRKGKWFISQNKRGENNKRGAKFFLIRSNSFLIHHYNSICSHFASSFDLPPYSQKQLTQPVIWFLSPFIKYLLQLSPLLFSHFPLTTLILLFINK